MATLARVTRLWDSGSQFCCLLTNSQQVSKWNASKGSSRNASFRVPPIASVQRSNARIGKCNKKSRFGDSLSSLSAEDDDLLCDVSNYQSEEAEDMDLEINNGKTAHKFKKPSSVKSKRRDEYVLPKLAKGLEGRKKLISSPAEELIKIEAHHLSRHSVQNRGAKSRASLKLKLQLPSKVELRSRTDWEEQAYKIIRRQKLRDAAVDLVKARLTPQAQRGTDNAHTGQICPPTADNENQRPATSSRVVGMEDMFFYRLATQLGFEEKWRPLVEYLHSLGLHEAEFCKIADRHKTCLQGNVNTVKERVDYLLSLGVKFEQLSKLIVRHPQIIEYTTEKAVKPRIKYLQGLGLPDSKLGRIITLAPTILEMSLERSLIPRVTYLENVVGIKSEDISIVVIRSPQILTQSIHDSLEPKINFFLEELKMPKESLAKMITRHPQLLHYSIEDGIRPRVEYLKSIGMTDDDVVKVLGRLTQVLSLSIKNCLQPKYEYLVKELSGGVHTVTSFPAYFSLSLEQRIIPRHRFLISMEKVPTGPFPMKVFTVSDTDFSLRWAKSSVKEYHDFRNELVLKFFAKKFEWKNKIQF